MVQLGLKELSSRGSKSCKRNLDFFYLEWDPAGHRGPQPTNPPGPTGPNIFGWSSPVGLWFTTFHHFDRPRRLHITFGNLKFSFEEHNTSYEAFLIA